MPQSKIPKAKRQDLSRKLRELVKTGLYTPKSTELTPSRIKTINRLSRENARLLGNEFVFVEAPPGAIKEAKQLDYKTTKKGLFVHKEGFERANITYSSRKRKFILHQKHRVKTGKAQGKIQDRQTVLASVDEITSDKERLRKTVQAFGPMRKDQYLVYIIHSNEHIYGANYSHNMYEDFDLMWDDLTGHYFNRKDWEQIVRTVSVERTTRTAHLKRADKRVKKQAKKGRRRGSSAKRT